MRTYEMMVIFHPTLDESAVAAEAEKTSELIKANGGEVAKVTIWGRRKLAYAINDQLEGSYVLFNFELEPSVLSTVEFNLKLDENILRYLVVKTDSVKAEAAVEEKAAVVEEVVEAVAEEETAPETTEEEPEA